MLDGLRFYWRSNVAVILAAAAATSVLTGALMVGDSVRGSLRDLTFERLGRIDYAVLSDSFVREALIEELAGDPDFGESFASAVPVVLIQGSVVEPDTGTRASRVNVQGIDAGFAGLFPEDPAPDFERLEGQLFPGLWINEALRAELGVEIGQELVLYLERPSDVPRESLMGSTDPEQVLRSLRLELLGVVPDRGLGRFGLTPHQSLPLNAFVDLDVLQRALGQRDRVNAALIARRQGSETVGEAAVERLRSILRSRLQLGDLGLQLVPVAGGVQIESRQIVLPPRLATAVEDFAAERGDHLQPILTHLANNTVLANDTVIAEGQDGDDRLLPYSTIAAFDPASSPELGALRLVDGSAAPVLAEDEILINRWAAEDLGAVPGDRIRISYYEVGPREELMTREAEFTLRGVVSMAELGADPALTPDFPGVADADDMSDWDPAFPVDLGLIRQRDEDYWDRYGAAPKLFVAETVGRRLWATRFGDLSAIRLAPAGTGSVDDLVTALETELPKRVDLRQIGIDPVAIKAESLESSRGATDFGGMFIGFSMFLIGAAAILVGLFFRLGVERRASEIGLLLAVGYSHRQVRRRYLGEGMLLGGLGVVLGAGGAVLYAAAMMAGLRTLWLGAVGSTFLELHVVPLSLVLGAVLSLLVVAFAVWRSVRRLAALPVIGLLRGVTLESGETRTRSRGRTVGLVALGVAVVLSAVGFGVGSMRAYLFFGVGACLLVAGLGWFAHGLAQPRGGAHGHGLPALMRMAAINAALNPGRSLLSAALVSSACFVIVAVGAFGLQFGDEVRERGSGAGGFSLVAEADVPLHHDLNDPEARFDLGFSSAASDIVDRSTIVPFRLLPGDDVSCLNLYRPEKPRLLGVPPEQIERDGFAFTQILSEAQNPWTLLEEDLGENIVPAFGDFNSVLWIMHSGLGKDVVIEDELGDPIRLRLVGLMRKSLFQSELLISEANFLQHFPSRGGYSYFLVETPEGLQAETAEALEGPLGEYGFDIASTAVRLANFQAVENTYLGTFQTLGGLGLLLGTVGLAVILLRNIIERRAELATLRALGFRRSALGWLVVMENSFLLVVGIAIGSASALVSVAPHLLEANALVPWGTLAATLLLVLVVGTAASAAAVRQALRAPLLPALRAE